jgi:hypothetical protein
MIATYVVFKRSGPNSPVYRQVDTIRVFGMPTKKVFIVKLPEGEYILIRLPDVAVREG